MKCKICEAESFYLASAKVLNKYDVSYFQCTNCRFVQTEDPYWLEEAYASPIAYSDAGLVFRNYMLSRVASNIIAKLFNPEANFLDCGGGYGLFVRLMRDINYKFFWQDKYCENIFAQGFEANLQEGETYEVVTSFEVFEHFVNPIAEMSELLKYSKNILFSTELLPDSDPKPEEWWYYAPHEGQHISFYTPQSLSILAERFGLNLYSNGSSLHLLTESNIPGSLFERLSYYDSLGLKDFLLLSRDYLQTIEKVDSEQYKVKLRETEAELGRMQAQQQEKEAELSRTQAQLEAARTEIGKTQTQLVQSQVQLHAAKTEIGRTQAQLHEKDAELVQSQAQLYQTQQEVERSLARLHQNEAKMAQSQAQLHQMQADLERSQEELQQRQEKLEVLQGQLYATEVEAANFQGQLHQTQADWERSQKELQQRQEKLEVLQGQLYATEVEAANFQGQLYATEVEAANFQGQLHQTQADWERSQEELHQRQEKLEVLQGQLHAAEADLVKLRSQEYRTQEELSQALSAAHSAQQEMKRWQSQYHSVFAEFEQSQSQLHQLQERLERSQAQAERVQWELQRAEFEQAVANQVNGNGQMPYRLLVWEGWYAYGSGDLRKMRECLQESLKFTSLPRTEIVSNWLESFSTFSSEKGKQLDSQALTNSDEWKQLMRRVLTKANLSKL